MPTPRRPDGRHGAHARPRHLTPRAAARWSLQSVLVGLIVGLATGLLLVDGDVRGRVADTLANRVAVPAELTVDIDAEARAVRPRTHVVSPGETVSRLAERYAVTSRSLMRANAIDDPRTLAPGQVLFVPEPDASRPLTPEAAVAADLPVEELLRAHAKTHGADPHLVQAIAWQESRWDQRVVSDKGAVGLMQLLPDTGELVAAHLGRPVDPYDPDANVEAGVVYLQLLADRHDGDLHEVLAGYYQGSHSVALRGRSGATQAYIADVLRYREAFAAAAAEGR
ncbi:MAG: lytic transglycosylase domain-containing protein [Egibacteraceae bacterium]